MYFERLARPDWDPALWQGSGNNWSENNGVAKKDGEIWPCKDFFLDLTVCQKKKKVKILAFCYRGLSQSWQRQYFPFKPYGHSSLKIVINPDSNCCCRVLVRIYRPPHEWGPLHQKYLEQTHNKGNLLKKLKNSFCLQEYKWAMSICINDTSKRA